MAKDLTLEELKQIRDELKQIKGKVQTTNERLGTTNERLDRLEHRQSATETRLATELVAVVMAVNNVRDLLISQSDLREKYDGLPGV